MLAPFFWLAGGFWAISGGVSSRAGRGKKEAEWEEEEEEEEDAGGEEWQEEE